MEVNVYCSKELFISEAAGVLHTPLLPEKMASSAGRHVEHTLTPLSGSNGFFKVLLKPWIV